MNLYSPHPNCLLSSDGDQRVVVIITLVLTAGFLASWFPRSGRVASRFKKALGVMTEG